MRLPRFKMASWSLLALIGGLALGTLGHLSGGGAFQTVEQFVKPLGDLWLSALQLLLLPVIVTQLLSAIAGSGEGAGRATGLLGLRTAVLIVVMLLVAGIATYFISRPLVAFYEADPSMVASQGGTTTETPPVAADGWALRLPTNLVEAARNGEVFTLLLFAALLGAAVTQLPEERRLPLTRTFSALAEATMIMVRWVLVATPAAVFALGFSAALRSGSGAAGMMGAFIVLVCGLLALFTLLLYPVTALLGNVSVRTFARAAAPAQLVAASTLSSIAALPALIEGAARHLRLPPRYTGFVLPLCVSLFKFNRTVSATAKLVFLAHVYGVPLSSATLAVFMFTVILLSFGALGVPNGGQAFTTLPAYVAAGLPVEAIILLEATSIVPDMLKTVLNVTGDMSVAAILSRSERAAATAPSSDDEAAALVPEGLA